MASAVGNANPRAQSMPLSLTCPHCERPMLLASKWRDCNRLCRQCGSAGLVVRRENRALPIPSHSLAQLRIWLHARRAAAMGL